MSPIPSNILTLYSKKKKKVGKELNWEDNIEHQELKGPMFREFTIHIFQSISFLQNLQEVDPEEINSRMKELPFTKGPSFKTVIFDLDETLAHCVRQEPTRTPDV